MLGNVSATLPLGWTMFKRVLLVLPAFLSACEFFPFPFSTIDPRAAESIRDHAEVCAESLGPIPGFDCRDGVRIPITIDGEAPDSIEPWMCDNPAMLDSSCNTEARVGRIPGDRPEVSFVFLCRATSNLGYGYSYFGNDDSYAFSLIAMIGHNAETGDTCFFETMSSNPVVPSPMTAGSEPDLGDQPAETVWQTPSSVASGGCNTCHSIDPYVHSPWIDSARMPGTDEPVVPFVAGGPYHVLGDDFRSWRVEVFDMPNHPCAACHAIGSETCEYLEYSVGQTTGGNLTDDGRTRWMPPPPAEATSDIAIDQLRRCCDRDRTTCQRFELPL